MNKKVVNIFVIAFLLMFVLMRIPAFADVGGINRYVDDTPVDIDREYNYSYNNGTTSVTISPGLVIIIIAVVVGIVVYMKKKGATNQEIIDRFTGILNNREENNYNNKEDYHIDNTEEVSKKIREIDPLFSSSNFLSWTNEVFIKLQNAWTKKDWKIIRPFESNELFQIHNTQLQEFIDSEKTNIIERICVNSSHLYSFSQDGDKETLSVILYATMRDYIIEDKTKKVLEGNPNSDCNMQYMLTFIRKSGVKTKEGTCLKSTTNCPNCGAPTSITSAGQCEYCGSVITTGEHDWVLSSLKGI